MVVQPEVASTPVLRSTRAPGGSQWRQGVTSLPLKTILWAAAAIVAAVPALANDRLRIGYVDPLSGSGASVGALGLKTFEYLADQLNAEGGVLGMKVEIVGYDDKLSAEEAVVQVQKAIDGGVRLITEGSGSGVAAAIEDFVTTYNAHNRGKEVLYLNYAAIDPVLTNEKCSYWHFRWDASSDIKMQALTDFIKTRPRIKKVYLINQDYSFGQSVRRTSRLSAMNFIHS
jgi:branched-chain amino acid transport system substrate-binding protein